jgi:hypothetical protein
MLAHGFDELGVQLLGFTCREEAAVIAAGGTRQRQGTLGGHAVDRSDPRDVTRLQCGHCGVLTIEVFAELVRQLLSEARDPFERHHGQKSTSTVLEVALAFAVRSAVFTGNFLKVF